MPPSDGPFLATVADAPAIAELLDAFNTEIDVDEGDVDARRLYERSGFTVVDTDTGERALYYSGPARWMPEDRT